MIWKTIVPPNEKWIEVEDEDGKIIKAMAYYGRDGCRPHWITEDERLYDCSKFSKWREIENV